MADSTISGLGSGGSLTGAELIPAVQGGTTVKITVQDIIDASPGAVYTSSNGITLAVTDFQLGGTLTQNTSIGGAGTYSLDLGTNLSRLSTFVVRSSNSNTLFFTDGTQSSLIFQNTGSTLINHSTGTTFSRLTFNGQAVTVNSDYSTFAGIQEGSNFSANYTSLSLINKGYAASVFVPYTGATTSLNMGNSNNVSAKAFYVIGSSGAGLVNLGLQASVISATGGGIDLFCNTAGNFSIADANGITAAFATFGNTNDNIYTLRDFSGTVAFLSDLGSYQPLSTNLTSLAALTYSSTSFVKMTASGTFALDTNTYLTTSAAALAYQPLDADLTSWALITRAAGFDTFVATPSSSNLASLVTDETGSGALVFGTSPTFTTDITTPLIIGGTAIGSKIQYKGTTGVGTSTVAAHEFLVGTNGATSSVKFYNDGSTNFGNATANATAFGIMRVGQGTSWVDIGEYQAGRSGIWGGAVAPTATNFGIAMFGGATSVNAATTSDSVFITNVSGVRATFGNYSLSFSPAARSSLATTNFTFTTSTNTGQTAGSNIPNFLVSGSSKTWSQGTVALQYFNWFTSNTTISGGGASSFTLVGNSVFEYPQGGSSATNVLSAAIYVPTLALTNTTTSYGIYVNAASGATTNYSVGFAHANTTISIKETSSTAAQISSSANLLLNSGSSANVFLQVNGVTKATFGVSSTDFVTAAQATGAVSAYTYSPGNNTNQTLSTEIPKVLYTLGSTQWATGTLATQPFFKITQPTISFVGSSTATLASTFYIAGAPNSGTNAIQTTNAALYIDTAAVNGTGTVGTSYGAFINAMTGATTNWAAGFNGNVTVLDGSFFRGRINLRVVSMTDATSFTPTGDTADINTQANTQAIGNLTANAPSGTPVNGQLLQITISSTNVQTFVWNAIYVAGTTTALPTVTTGATKTDKFFFQYNSTVSKWQLINAQYGYV